mmetsp:Transcript_34343/g.51810  ORF Transcript_34343/g.51810 Transcript_34343/m.51810 type:complete len:171 (+) Transcript_34343:32-544(+)
MLLLSWCCTRQPCSPTQSAQTAQEMVTTSLRPCRTSRAKLPHAHFDQVHSMWNFTTAVTYPMSNHTGAGRPGSCAMCNLGERDQSPWQMFPRPSKVCHRPSGERNQLARSNSSHPVGVKVRWTEAAMRVRVVRRHLLPLPGPLNQAPGWEALHGQKVYNAAEIWAADYAE